MIKARFISPIEECSLDQLIALIEEEALYSASIVHPDYDLSLSFILDTTEMRYTLYASSNPEFFDNLLTIDERATEEELLGYIHEFFDSPSEFISNYS